MRHEKRSMEERRVVSFIRTISDYIQVQSPAARGDLMAHPPYSPDMATSDYDLFSHV